MRMPGEIEKTALKVQPKLSHVFDENADPYEIDLKIQPFISHYVEDTGGGGGGGGLTPTQGSCNTCSCQTCECKK